MTEQLNHHKKIHRGCGKKRGRDKVKLQTKPRGRAQTKESSLEKGMDITIVSRKGVG